MRPRPRCGLGVRRGCKSTAPVAPHLGRSFRLLPTSYVCKLLPRGRSLARLSGRAADAPATALQAAETGRTGWSDVPPMQCARTGSPSRCAPVSQPAPVSVEGARRTGRRIGGSSAGCSRGWVGVTAVAIAAIDRMLLAEHVCGLTLDTLSAISMVGQPRMHGIDPRHNRSVFASCVHRVHHMSFGFRADEFSRCRGLPGAASCCRVAPHIGISYRCIGRLSYYFFMFSFSSRQGRARREEKREEKGKKKEEKKRKKKEGKKRKKKTAFYPALPRSGSVSCPSKPTICLHTESAESAESAESTESTDIPESHCRRTTATPIASSQWPSAQLCTHRCTLATPLTPQPYSAAGVSVVS